MLFALKSVMINGAALPNSDAQIGRAQMNISTLFAGQNSNFSFILYPTSSFEIETFEFMLGEIRQEVVFGMTTSCNSIQLNKELCQKDQSNCQVSKINIDNAENAMKIHMRTLFTVSRICELPTHPSSTEAINRCHRGMQWTEKEDATKKFSFLSDMFESYTSELLRLPRFVISSSIVIATAIGAASVATAGVTAHYVAKSETDRIVEEQQVLRAIDVDNNIHNNLVNHNITLTIAKDLDNIRYTSALSAKGVNDLHHAGKLNNEITHMFSKASVLSFSDPSSEQWFTSIEEIVLNNTQGLTSSEAKEAVRISADLTSIVTTKVPLSRVSLKCEDTMLLKTMIVPHIKYHSLMNVRVHNGLFSRATRTNPLTPCFRKTPYSARPRKCLDRQHMSSDGTVR